MTSRWNGRNLLSTFWIERNSADLPRQLGVSAYSLTDALTLLEEYGYTLDFTKALIQEHIRLTDLDQGHVIPNSGVITRRGIWYPNHNASTWR